MLKIASIKHCPECGAKYPVDTSTLKEITCNECKHTHYFNRNSVTVLLVPSVDYSSLWLGKRMENPGEGKWAMPAGFSIRGESWRQTGARELFEEMNIVVKKPEENIQSIEVETATGKRNDLVFGIVNPHAVTVGNFLKNKEVSNRILFMEGMTPLEIAFPLHETVMLQYFKKKYRFRRK